MPTFTDLLEVRRPWSDWIFLRQERDVQGGGFHIHNPWGNSTQPQGAADRNRLEIAYRTAAGQDLWGQVVLHGPSGRVGLGTVNPQARLEVNNPWGDWIFLRQQRDAQGGGFHIHNPWGNSTQPQGAADRNRLEIAYRTSAGQDLWGQVVLHGPTGRVGLGIANPQARLHVNGDVIVTGDIALPQADLAEQFTASGEPAEPGTVVVLEEEGCVRECTEAYDHKVAGVVSGAGSYRPAIVLDQDGSRPDRTAIAMVGKVYCKADAAFDPIRTGDLLTTSATPGHAMKASDPDRAFGAIIGKALRPLENGRGLIPILVALQ